MCCTHALCVRSNAGKFTSQGMVFVSVTVARDEVGSRYLVVMVSNTRCGPRLRNTENFFVPFGAVVHGKRQRPSTAMKRASIGAGYKKVNSVPALPAAGDEVESTHGTSRWRCCSRRRVSPTVTPDNGQGWGGATAPPSHKEAMRGLWFSTCPLGTSSSALPPCNGAPIVHMPATAAAVPVKNSTGLGLPLARSFAWRAGGWLNLEDIEGDHMTRLWAVLPCDKPLDVEEEAEFDSAVGPLTSPEPVPLPSLPPSRRSRTHSGTQDSGTAEDEEHNQRNSGRSSTHSHGSGSGSHCKAADAVKRPSINTSGVSALPGHVFRDDPSAELVVSPSHVDSLAPSSSAPNSPLCVPCLPACVLPPMFAFAWLCHGFFFSGWCLCAAP